ncbi:hypothetical protein BCN13_26935 [Salmonella enterica]|nr:hypothetical protein [Salmonella enterica]EAO7619017.1 hypothetical protein [Salmonella enterica]EAQ6819607.1 hypothetical protein [Salmonella enterica]
MDVQDGDSFNHGVNIMSKTPTPTITITVSGPTGSGKSRVLAMIADALKLIHGDKVIIDSPELDSEKRMSDADYTHWHSPRSGTVFKLDEINLPGSLQKRTIRGMSHSEVMAWFEEYGFRDKVGHPLTLNLDFRELLYLALDHQGKPGREITVDDLVDRPVPVHIQALMSKLGISFEEYKETDLQPVVGLVNWALTTPPVPEQTTQAYKKGNEYSSRNPNCLSGVVNKDEQNAPQPALLTPEDIVRQVTESLIAILDCHKQQQIHHEELTEKIRKEILNLHNKLG